MKKVLLMALFALVLGSFSQSVMANNPLDKSAPSKLYKDNGLGKSRPTVEQDTADDLAVEEEEAEGPKRDQCKKLGGILIGNTCHITNGTGYD